MKVQLPVELEEELNLLTREANSDHKEFNTSMITVCSGILAGATAILGIFTQIDSGLAYLRFSTLCFASVVALIVFYNVINVDGRKILISSTRTIYESNAGKTYTKGEIYWIKKKVQLDNVRIKILKFVNNNSHWIVFVLFLVGMISLLRFTFVNIKPNVKPQENSTTPTPTSVTNNYYYDTPTTE